MPTTVKGLGPFKRMVIMDECDRPYLIRYAFNTWFGGIKLHHILRSDNDRALHDHPWNFRTFILWGGYWEHTPMNLKTNAFAHPILSRARLCAPSSVDGTLTLRCWRGPGSYLRRPAEFPHRLELEPGRTAWTIVFTSNRTREWGFHTIKGWIPWRAFNADKDCE